MSASTRFYCAEYKWFINNGPCGTFSMLEMGSIRLTLVALCDDVLLFVAIFFVLVVKLLQR